MKLLLQIWKLMETFVLEYNSTLASHLFGSLLFWYTVNAMHGFSVVAKKHTKKDKFSMRVRLSYSADYILLYMLQGYCRTICLVFCENIPDYTVYMNCQCETYYFY